jgi:triphosphoribosyl-dephospho-CoA synthase
VVGWTLQTAGTFSELVVAAHIEALPRAALPRRDQQGAYLATLAVQALIDEALLTPKPALVDLRGSGAHYDLDLACMLNSARSLRGAFSAMAEAAGGARIDGGLRETLASIGRAGEQDMFAVTGGRNAHRGAIWVLGLLVAARAMVGPERSPRDVAAAAGRIACFPDRHAPVEDSHGSRVCAAYGVVGARGEAQAGLPHVINAGLPAMWAARAAGVGEACAQLDALMAIMCTLDDTCVLHRAGTEALAFAKNGAQAVLAEGGSASAAGRRALLRLDAGLLRRHASPGGCADLLSACLFLDRCCLKR